MSSDFFKKIKNIFKANVSNKSFTKPSSETVPSPVFLWNILITTYFLLMLAFVILTSLSYQFLTKDREGVADSNLTATQVIDTNKIDNVNHFFEQRSKNIEDVYKKTIIEP